MPLSAQTEPSQACSQHGAMRHSRSASEPARDVVRAGVQSTAEADMVGEEYRLLVSDAATGRRELVGKHSRISVLLDA